MGSVCRQHQCRSVMVCVAITGAFISLCAPWVHDNLSLKVQRHVECIDCGQDCNADNDEHHARVGTQPWHRAPLVRVDLPEALEHVGCKVLPGLWLCIPRLSATLCMLLVLQWWWWSTWLRGCTHNPHVWQRQQLEP